MFPKGIQSFIIDGRNGMHGLDSIFFMFKKFKNLDIEWLIMADEDVIFQNADEVFNLIQFMEVNNYSISGVRDGGVIVHRDKNPFSINTFFSILNFKKLLEVYNKNEILKNRFIRKNEFHDDLKSLKYSFDQTSLYEPYYCFYFYFRRLGEKILFLDSDMLADEKENISNQVFNTNSAPLLTHTWYARAYGENKRHTERINRILEDLNFNSEYSQPIIFKDKTFWFKSKFKKTLKKIRLKLSKNAII